MRTDKKSGVQKRRRLAGEILEYLLLSLAISAFTFCFLYFTSESMADTYLAGRDVVLSPSGQTVLGVWLRSICLTASVVLFLILFLFLLGQRMAYLLKIIHGVDDLQASHMDASILLEGNDELTELAEKINALAESERELDRKERQMKEERDAWIRSLSHDIRTPLTSMISYTQLLADRHSLSETDIRDYIHLIQAKTEQIRELTDRLSGRKRQNPEKVEHIRLLLEQLALEWEESLEGHFSCEADFSGLTDFSGMADIYAFRRIFDNLASNTLKYADPAQPVTLTVTGKENLMIIIQKNGVKKYDSSPESTGIGLENIRRIAADYDGTLEVRRSREDFSLEISMKIPACL
ncbi:MAG TPA: HAMP domain-containing histidine kinase [Candidatus Eisenbergiella merdipullorum]|uniref:histidine kinase n=1 Tax=Candidatus Eisenbergiella merdipullorum TaxID=2838553 RepID=A0A9D2I5B6_9FIRM|nr:HAMP domain-containing histidine kinase [Candidatus Eisenbergiella merdipullorum]